MSCIIGWIALEQLPEFLDRSVRVPDYRVICAASAILLAFAHAVDFREREFVVVQCLLLVSEAICHHRQT